MNKLRIGVDLAHKLIQVCSSTNNKVHSNNEMTLQQFSEYLVSLSSSTIIFEACASANYWHQFATSLGHNSLLISARLVMSVRQSQKTDKNDALAVLQASLLPDVHFITAKSINEQQAQSMLKLREHSVKQKVALKNQLTGLLREFNISSGRSISQFVGTIQDTLEDAENGFCDAFRKMLKVSLDLYLTLTEAIATYDLALAKWVDVTPSCKKLMRLEGVGILNAIHLFINLSSGELARFKAGKDAAACIGLTPTQHSSGGKVSLGRISRRRNTTLRSLLITGAMAVIQQVVKREPKTSKERWLKALIERRGKKCAAVALANKTVRTAFSLINNKTEYKAVLL